MKFIEMKHDFGLISDKDTVRKAFVFKNEGVNDLVISSITVHCGCTVVDEPHSKIRPNSIDSISVSFNPKGTVGEQVRTVDVEMNTDPPLHQLSIKSVVQKAHH
ncbi:DUF1573 domain-containing protein [Fibrella sp. WM1]|uniref:DUF1573 domain-containing protein n=1 Tax=Fibrella musci TaxID=3242485 RepID=UPI0035205782